MLASILPGVRDLRTPLAVGYLIFIDLWVITRGAILPARMESPFVASLYEFFDLVGTPGALAIASFLAYLVGSVVQVNRLPLPRRLFPAAENLRTLPEWRLRWSMRLVRVLHRLGLQFARPQDDAVNWMFLEIGLRLREVDDALVKLSSDYTISPSFRRTLQGYLDPLRHAHPDLDGMAPDRRAELTYEALATAMEVELTGEMKELETRLQIERESLFHDFDRLRSEAQLRFSIFVPSLVLIISSAFQEDLWLASLVVIPLWLLRDGLRRQYLAESIVWNSLVMGLTTSPTVERLRVWVDAREAHKGN